MVTYLKLRTFAITVIECLRISQTFNKKAPLKMFDRVLNTPLVGLSPLKKHCPCNKIIKPCGNFLTVFGFLIYPASTLSKQGLQRATTNPSLDP